MTESQIREELVVPKATEFLDDIPDSELKSGKFVRKEDFLDPLYVNLIGIGKSSFDDKVPKWDLYIKIEDNEKILTITGTYVTELKKLFGKPSEWSGKKVLIEAVPGEWNIRGEKQQGFALKFTKA